MLFPQEQINAGKQALQALWNDTATCTRSGEIDGVIGEEQIYTNIKCHLSQDKQPTQIQGDTAASAKSVFKLFVDTSVIIKQGDKLKIMHKTQSFEGIAGQPFHSSFNNVIPLEVLKIS